MKKILLIYTLEKVTRRSAYVTPFDFRKIKIKKILKKKKKLKKLPVATGIYRFIPLDLHPDLFFCIYFQYDD